MNKRRICDFLLIFSLFSLWGWGGPIITAEETNTLESSTELMGFEEFEEEFGMDINAKTKIIFDPLRGYNRFMFNVNDKLYFWVVKPASKGYRKVIPEKARISLNRAFVNIGFPIRFANSLLQLKPKKAGIELIRFVANSTVGIAGFFDPAKTYLHLEPSEEDFGQTLGRYGVGDGFPIILPVLGPTNLRDMIGMAPDYFLTPVTYIDPSTTQFSIWTGEKVNQTSLHVGEYESFKNAALDPYTFMRNAYKQNRDQKIKE